MLVMSEWKKREKNVGWCRSDSSLHTSLLSWAVSLPPLPSPGCCSLAAGPSQSHMSFDYFRGDIRVEGGSEYSVLLGAVGVGALL